MKLVTTKHCVDYNIRQLYNISLRDGDIEYILRCLWDMRDLKLDPRYLPYTVLKTHLGEMLIQKTVFKSTNFFLKLVEDHFVFIYNNQRKVIPICSHLQ
jgi:hypothetical protein